MVTVFPDVSIRDRTEDDKFLVIGCDGLWDIMSNEAACNFINSRYSDLDTFRMKYMDGMIKMRERKICRKQGEKNTSDLIETLISEIETIRSDLKFTTPVDELTEIQKLHLVNEMLVTECTVSKDNVSIIIVKLK